MSNWGQPGGRGDFHRNRAASEDGEETGEVPETHHANMGSGTTTSNTVHHHHGGHHHNQGTNHRAPSPVGSSHFRGDNFRGGRGGGRFGGRGGRHRHRHNTFSGGPPPPPFHRGGDFRNEPKIHRDASFGSSSGPPPQIGHRETSFGSQGSRAFRDGPFRDQLHHGRDGPPPFSRRGEASGPMRDEFPPPRGGDRDIPMSVGGSDVGIDRTRSTDSTREAPFVPGGTGIRDSSFGQGGPRPPVFVSRGPDGRDVPGQIHPHGSAHNRMDNRSGQNVMHSPNSAGPLPTSRPTDPRRRASSSDVGTLPPQGIIAASVSGEGTAGLPSPRRHSHNDGPSGLGPASPSQPRRPIPYASLASDGQTVGGGSVLPRPGGGGYRSPEGGMRRAISETGVQGERNDFNGPVPIAPPKPWSPGDRSRSAPVVVGKNEADMGQPPAYGRTLQFERQHSTGSTAPSLARMSDPRFNRADGISDEMLHSRNDVGSLPTVPESFISEETAPATVDPFGRSREWAQKPHVVAMSSSGGFKHSSPSSIKSSKSPLSSPSGEKSMLTAPKFPMTSAGDSSDKEPAKCKPEPLPPIPISALGSTEKILRAEVVITHFNEVTFNAATTPDATGKLPSKADIMAAVATIEKMIKQTQKESEENEEAFTAAKKEERELKAAEEAKQEEKEKNRRLEIAKKLEERKKEEDKMKAEVDLQVELETKVRFEAKKKELEEFFDGQLLKAKGEETARCSDDLEARISEASSSLEKGVAKARRDLEKSKNAAEKIGKKLAASETEYRALVESEEKKRKQKKAASHKQNFVQIKDIVKSVTEENRRKANEAHMFTFSIAETAINLGCRDDEISTKQKFLEEAKDPKYHKTFEEWSIMARQVTGLSDALYSEPSETPFYDQIQRTHEVIAPLAKEYIRDKNNRLTRHWTELAEEYEVRKRLYEKQQRKLAKKARGSFTVTSRPSIIGTNKEKKETPEEKPSEPAARSSNNPYRRARRGNEVRSEYEQEQIIAEIAAKEAMERRITHGGSKMPRQILPLERELTATYIHSFTSQRIDDPCLEAKVESVTNVWTDMEKCIFLDRFLQFPKDFRRIASFLRNKTTKDCIAFYYDSKQTVPYKGALKEHMMRRKRKGDYQIWDASIQAVISVGGTVTAGEDEEKPVNFGVPDSDMTFKTILLHPLRRDVLDAMVIDETAAAEYEDTGDADDSRWKSRKRGRDPLFILDKEQTKFLRPSSQEAMTNTKPSEEIDEVEVQEGSSPPEAEMLAKKSSQKQKWTSTEKKIFVETLDKHGKDWSMLAKAVTTKSLPQIKNFFYDYKKQTERQSNKADKKAAKAAAKQEKVKKTDLTASKKRKSPPLEEHVADPPTPPPSTEPSAMLLPQDDRIPMAITQELLNSPHILQHLQHRHLESLQRNQMQQREQELQELMERNSQQYGEAEVRSQSDLSGPQAQAELLEQLLSGSQEYNSELIQLLVSRQQAQQQQRHGSIDLSLQQQQQPQQRSPALRPQSALHRLLSQQHHQREHQQQQQQQVSQLEEARRLLEQQSQQQALSNLFPSLASSPHLFQPQQSRLQHAQLAAALQQQDGGSALTDVASIQRLIQLQQQQQRQNNPFLSLGQNHSQLGSLLGLSSSAGSGISAGLLAGLGANHAPAQAERAPEDLAALLGRYANVGQLGGGSTPQNSQLGAASHHLFRQGGNSAGNATPDGNPSVSDTLQLLQRVMQRDNASQHGFGSPGGN